MPLSAPVPAMAISGSRASPSLLVFTISPSCPRMVRSPTVVLSLLGSHTRGREEFIIELMFFRLQAKRKERIVPSEVETGLLGSSVKLMAQG